MLKIGIVGISGRMGHVLWDCCLGMDSLKVVCGIDRNTDGVPVGCNVEVVENVNDLKNVPDVFVDFSRWPNNDDSRFPTKISDSFPYPLRRFARSTVRRNNL